MSIYQNILVAVDVSNEAETVLARAIEMANKFDAQISLTHIIEPVLSETDYGLTPTFNFDVEQNLAERAKDFLDKLAKKLHLDPVKSIVTIGNIKHEIHQLCKKENIDLVIIGTHGRHGFSLLLGSTANAVLHGTECDVLTVKV
ncbi:MAG TPA: universal stress protein [Gammaproteobacteria bacterium]|nr:universal stress protein [Gammaproteobacteria bacterium]